MSTAVLVTTAKTRTHSKCPLTEERIQKVWYIHRIEYYSAIKKSETMPSAETWMDLDISISEVSQTETNI